MGADEGVLLKATSVDGKPLAVRFVPEKGMNFISFKKGDIEVIDQSTRSLFEARYAGLGAMIGPHFHHRNPSVIPAVNPTLFPHFAHVKPGADPFSHGIGRYAPWKIESITENALKAHLSGNDIWNGLALKEIEGQNFNMSYSAKLGAAALEIELSVTSDTESVVGLHTYYALGKRGTITTKIQEHRILNSELKPIPSTWNYSSDHTLVFPVEEEIDCGFQPFLNPLQGQILLDCETHQVKIHYTCNNQENSFQIWHPLDTSFVCIEPLSAKDPRKPKLSVSTLKICISIV